MELAFGDFLKAIDQAPTRGAMEEGLGVGRTEVEIGDDVGLTDPDGKPRKVRLPSD